MEATRLPLRERAISVAIGRRRDPARHQTNSILGQLAWLLAGALFLVGALLLVRRLTGAFTAPLGGGVILALGGCCVLAAVTARLLWRRAGDEAAAFAWRFRDWLPTIALVFVATSVAFPGSSLAAIALLWGMIGVEEVAAAWLSRIATKHRIANRSTTRPSPKSNAPGGERIGHDVWQRHTRQRTADGQEFVHGTLRTSFAAGQRTTIEHLVFCPMLAGAPQLMAIVLDESDCTVRATHVYRYGARLEIRLHEPCDAPAEVLVRYEARG